MVRGMTRQGFVVWGLGFEVWGLGCVVWSLGFGFWGLGFGGLLDASHEDLIVRLDTVEAVPENGQHLIPRCRYSLLHAGFGIWDFGVRVQDFRVRA